SPMPAPGGGTKMLVIEYDVGPGAYGVAQAGDGAVWTSLPERGALARVGPDGQVSRVPLDAGPSRPMVLAPGPDGALWCTLNHANAIARITPAGGVTTYPLPTAGAAPVGIHAGPESVWFAEIGAGQIGRIFPDGRIDEFPLPDRSGRPHAVVATADGGCWATLWAASAAIRLDRDRRPAEVASFRPGAEPHGIALGRDGFVWVALEAGTLAGLAAG
ncbi:MAG TPA: virginiamycin B lyase, partial [Trebonia sp.]|nr:virginiamycin B lyase [Trebonia sp.]